MLFSLSFSRLSFTVKRHILLESIKESTIVKTRHHRIFCQKYTKVRLDDGEKSIIKVHHDSTVLKIMKVRYNFDFSRSWFR